MQQRWRILTNGEVLDKVFSVEDLRAAVAEGQLEPQTLAFIDATQEWAAMNQIPGLLGTNSVSPTVTTQKVKKERNYRAWLVPALAALLAGGAGVGGSAAYQRVKAEKFKAEDAVVRVSTANGYGTGFFVQGPDEWAYVATAFHVVDSGAQLLVSRTVDVAGDKYYVEAYPEAQVVAFDTDSDLAIIRLKNVRATRFGVLPLASAPSKDQAIKAYGFPADTLIQQSRLVSQEGKVLGPGKFPVLDARTKKVLKSNSTNGLLITPAVDKGYSGGPACNERGEVVGITVLKDRTKEAHNGAINVSELAKLLQRVAPLDKPADPSPEQVVALIKRVEREYLMLPAEQRINAREADFVALTDLPRLHQFAAFIRRVEPNTQVPEAVKGELALSPSANLGLFLARQPGKLLETFRTSTVHSELSACDRNALKQQDIRAQVDSDEQTRSTAFAMAIAECDEKAVRPLAWDLAATSLQWGGNERDLSVAKVERVDQEEQVYKTTVLVRGASSSFNVWVRAESGELKLKLFDGNNNAYGLLATRALSAQDLTGTWKHTAPNRPLPVKGLPGLTYTFDITLDIGAEPDGHVVASTLVTGKVNSSAALCGFTELFGTLQQRWSGSLEGGAATLSAAIEDNKFDPQRFANCQLQQLFPYQPDVRMTVKLADGKLIAYPTDGRIFPEEYTFTRVNK